MRARSARSAVLGVMLALAFTTAGPGHGLVEDDSSTRGAQTTRPATAEAGPVPETSTLQPKPGIQPSETVPRGSTRDKRPPGSGNPDLEGKLTLVMDKSDEGVKNLPVTKDRGTKNLPATRDLGR